MSQFSEKSFLCNTWISNSNRIYDLKWSSPFLLFTILQNRSWLIWRKLILSKNFNNFKKFNDLHLTTKYCKYPNVEECRLCALQLKVPIQKYIT
jgi:hypothetical protein